MTDVSDLEKSFATFRKGKKKEKVMQYPNPATPSLQVILKPALHIMQELRVKAY